MQAGGFQTGQTGLSPVRFVEGIGELVLEQSWKARNYRLTLRRDGKAVLTLPVRGRLEEGLAFARQHAAWLERARRRQSRKPLAPEVWLLGTRILWRGEQWEIRQAQEWHQTDLFASLAPASKPRVCLAADVFSVPSLDGDLKPALEEQFLSKAKIELPGRAWELAALTRLDMKQVSVRNQRSRWGSCSSGGVISLNWRLIRTPDFVRDYIIYHELAHLVEMNHSERFWALVGKLCPDWKAAEVWLKQNGSLLGL